VIFLPVNILGALSMRTVLLLILCTASFSAFAQTAPTDPKAKATFDEAEALRKALRYPFALDAFRKANKQDGGHCQPCMVGAVRSALQMGDYKAAEQSAHALIDMATTNDEKAEAHTQLGVVLVRKGAENHKDENFAAAESELKTSLDLRPNDAPTLLASGIALAYRKQDDAAKAQFAQSLKLTNPHSVEYQRVTRYAERPELARARMAPPFRVTTMDGKTVSLDSLTGKVVLIDFWATWCGPCREALPHIRNIAQKFQGEPLVVLSVSLDSDNTKWEDFVSKNEMTWLQYRDGGFTGPLSKLFAVRSIPHTFTIDADGVLQDEHIGDGSIEGKLKKQIARARQLQATSASPTTAQAQ
jgi:thiol-disulfide isomerase/thioredoxin